MTMLTWNFIALNKNKNYPFETFSQISCLLFKLCRKNLSEACYNFNKYRAFNNSFYFFTLSNTLLIKQFRNNMYFCFWFQYFFKKLFYRSVDQNMFYGYVYSPAMFLCNSKRLNFKFYVMYSILNCIILAIEYL